MRGVRVFMTSILDSKPYNWVTLGMEKILGEPDSLNIASIFYFNMHSKH